jgi:zinc transporter ZupT
MTPVPVAILAWRGAIAVAAAVLGAVLAAIFGRATREHSSVEQLAAQHQHLDVLINFSAGALLAVAAFHLLPEAAHSMKLWPAVASAALGALTFILVDRFLEQHCPACFPHGERRPLGRIGALVIVAMSLHSVMDGLALVAAYVARTGPHPLASEANIGILVLVAVAVHKVPEGMTLASLRIHEGSSPSAAVLVTLAVELATGAGVGFGLLLHGAPFGWVMAVLGFTAGSFVYVVLLSLLAQIREGNRVQILVQAGLGVAMVLILARALEGAGV